MNRWIASSRNSADGALTPEMRPLWRISRALIVPLFRALTGFRVENAHWVPPRGPVILAPNHNSWWDPPLVGIAAPREVYFLAKEELFTTNRLFGWLIRTYNAIPIRRETGGLEALRTALRLLDQGKAVVIFPEGTRNRTEHLLLPLKPGVFLLAKHSGAPVVPAFILHNREPFHRWLLRKAPPVVRFGPPLWARDFPNDKKGRAFNQALRQALEQLARELGVPLP